ncbi:hypothetical protein [Glutamicibacter sp. FBE19]|uniref:hypothetical protein n=1 Tax=Glutamicibacter sp. FBE19 TaxID=2761534 RepID=UPI0019D671A2|nr:hypothetical protein [Glutamicibacter sp. FBE19]MBF6672451.1 hypothetical protein [Glutamicibacter sp. FBE19]
MNQGTVDATNLALDPLSTNPALYRSTGSLGMATVGGVTAIKATATTANVLEMVIDKRYYSDVEGFRVGDTVYWSAEVYVTTPMTVQATVSFYAGGNEDTTAALTPQVPADGWVRHYAKSVITAAPAGSYFDYRIRPQQSGIPVGQGFLFRNMIISKNKDVPFFSGATANNPLYNLEWAGTVNNSASLRRVPANSDVLDLKTRVLVNGVQREILSWSVDREITNDLPAQVVGGSGVSQATGTIEWASKDVESGALNPWNPSTGWIPAEGDRVDIFVGDGLAEWKQFTGLIDKTNGSIGGGIQSSLVDDIDKLSAIVDIPALMTGMPPLTEGGAWRRVGVSSRFHQNTALRMSGFYSTPKPEWGCVLDVPMQSSMWPLRGKVITCSKRSDTAQAPDSYGASWGTAIGDFTARYEPSVAQPFTSPVQLTIMRTANHGLGSSAFGYVRVEYGSASKSIELHVNASGAFIRVNNATVTSVPCSGDTICQLLHKNGVLTLKTSQGQTVSVTQAVGATGNVTSIVTAGDVNARIAGVQVSHPTTTAHEFASLGHVPTAIVTTGAANTGALVLPAVNGITAKELLQDIGEKTLRPMWISETGIATSLSADSLYERSPVQAITTLDDIRELSWERSLLSVRSEVRTSYRQPTINSRTTPSVEAWSQSGSVVLQSGETQETFIEPASDEDWIMPDAGLEIIGIGGITNINKGATSVATGVLTDGVNESWATQGSPAPLTITSTQLGPSKFLVTHKAGTLPAGYQVELRTVSEDFSGATALWPYWWGKEMPRWTAYAVVTWTTIERTPTIAGVKGSVLEHDCGPWLTSGSADLSAIDALSSFIATQVTSPAPTITGMRVGYDPRRQLGDVIIVSSRNFMGVELRCLIVGISNSAGNSGYEQSLTVRVISATTSYTTYQQFVNAWGNSATYSNFLAAWDSISTYADFNNDPLRGTN